MVGQPATSGRLSGNDAIYAGQDAVSRDRHTCLQPILPETLHSEHLDTLSVLRLDGRKITDGC